MEIQKLTEEELNEIKTLNSNFNQTFVNIGITQSQIAELEARRDDFYDVLINLRNTEQEVFKKLKEKYGEGVVDLNTGEFKSDK